MNRLRVVMRTNPAARMATVATVAVTVGLATTLLMRSADGGGPSPTLATEQTNAPGYMDLVLPASSVHQLLQESEVVVVGYFTGEVGSTDTVFPAGAGSALPNGLSSGVAFSNLVFNVTSYVRGSGPDHVLIRQTGDLRASQGPAEFPRPHSGVQMLMFLDRDPHGDNTWTSDRGPWGRVRMEAGGLRYGDGESTLVPFFAGKDLTGAIATVRAANP